MTSKIQDSRVPVKTAFVLLASVWMLQASASEQDSRLVVKYADLNLASPQDAQRLYSRLKGASREVCRYFEGRELSRLPQRKSCYAKALSKAVQSVNHASVDALHAASRNVRVAQRSSSTEPRS